MIEFKKGQTYICEKSFTNNWIEGKEYKVEYEEISDEYVIYDELGFIYFDFDINGSRHVFKLKDDAPMEEPPKKKEPEERTTNLIKNQTHYKNQGIEPIDLMRKNFSKEEFAGFLKGNVLKYMLRYKDKNGVEDLKKAYTYLTWLIEEETNA